MSPYGRQTTLLLLFPTTISHPLLSTFPPFKPTPHPTIVTKQDERTLEKVQLGAKSNFSLRELAHRALKYSNERSRAHEELMRMPTRYAEMSKEFARLAERPQEGREMISYGTEGSSASLHTSGVNKWTRDPKLLFETLDNQDEALFGKTPSTPEECVLPLHVHVGSFVLTHVRLLLQVVLAWQLELVAPFDSA